MFSKNFKCFDKKAVTMVETLLVTVMISMVLTTTLSIYASMWKVKVDVQMREMLIKSSYDIVEKLNIVMQNYTIDYEEYFNRRIVWCDNKSWNDFEWDVNADKFAWYCDQFTEYGNRAWNDNKKWRMYYCSTTASVNESPTWKNCNNQWNWNNYVYKTSSSSDIKDGKWCWDNATSSTDKYQAFGQYKLQFLDVKSDSDGAWWCMSDDDDDDSWIWPLAIWVATWVQELYLISKDKRKRIFLRRAFVREISWDYFDTNDNSMKTYTRPLYTIQILKLRWFDAWEGHDFVWTWVYDWQIDTRACDYKEWFVCNGASVSPAYEKYKYPNSVNDGWVDLTNYWVTISDWNLQIFPTRDPDLMWWTWVLQINPYVRLYLETKIYPENWKKNINPEILSWYKMDIQTTFNMKNY